MQNQDSNLFGFGIDEVAQYHLTSIAKWNRFLSIVSIVIYGLAILFLLFGGSYLMTTFAGLGTSGINAQSGVFTGVLIIYAIIFVILMIPNFFRLNSSNKMLKALASQDQQLLNESFAHLKTFGKYWGILTIIGIAFYAIVIIIAILAATMA